MRNALPLAACVALLLVLSWWHGKPQLQIKSAPSAEQLPGQQQPRTVLRGGSRSAGQVDSKGPPDYIVESARKRDEFMLREAETYPDEVRLILVNSTMKSVRQVVDPLLESWRIDLARRREVLDVFHKLETASLDIYVAHLKNGLSGQPKRRQEQEAEDALANFQLESLVGADHAAELLKARQDLRTRMSVEGIKNANASRP